MTYFIKSGIIINRSKEFSITLLGAKKRHKMDVSKKKSGAAFLIFLTWLVYACSYLGKVNYSANIVQIVDYFGITKAEAGIVPTFFFFSYGIGQVVNGLLCKKYNLKWMIFSGLLLSATINLIVAITPIFEIVKWLWLINGFLLSILWPSLIRLLSESLPKKELGRSSVVMGTTVATGTLIIYALSSLYVELGNFKLAFYTAAFVNMAVALFWIISCDKAVSMSKNEMDSENNEDNKGANTSPNTPSNMQKGVLVCICVLCFCAVGVNLIKDGLTSWCPSILKEAGNFSDSLSILLTLFLPIVAMFGNAFAVLVHKKIPDYVIHCMTAFAVIALIIGAIIGGLKYEIVALILIGMVVANFLASSLNSLITSVFPMFMREKVNSGRCAGILNGFCYVGSAISSYGLGKIADHFGWDAVFYCLLGASGAIIAVCIFYALSKKAISK